MLEDSDYEQIDSMSLFFGECDDICFGFSSSASIIEVFTRYVDLTNSIFKRSGRPRWTNQELLDLESDANKFKKIGTAIIGLHQSFCMTTSTWHTLDNEVEAVIQVESVQYLDKGLFEVTHKCPNPSVYTLQGKEKQQWEKRWLEVSFQISLTTCRMKIGNRRLETLSVQNTIRK